MGFGPLQSVGSRSERPCLAARTSGNLRRNGKNLVDHVGGATTGLGKHEKVQGKAATPGRSRTGHPRQAHGQLAAKHGMLGGQKGAPECRPLDNHHALPRDKCDRHACGPLSLCCAPAQSTRLPWLPAKGVSLPRRRRLLPLVYRSVPAQSWSISAQHWLQAAGATLYAFRLSVAGIRFASRPSVSMPWSR